MFKSKMLKNSIKKREIIIEEPEPVEEIPETFSKKKPIVGKSVVKNIEDINAIISIPNFRIKNDPHKTKQTNIKKVNIHKDNILIIF